MNLRKTKPKRAKNEQKKKKTLTNKQKRLFAAVFVILLVLGIGYGRTIIKLQAENRNLKKEQAELTSEETDLTKELKNIHSKDYIQDQARKRLRLLNQDEKLFIFKDKDDD